MENKIKIFESEEFGRIRTVIINDERVRIMILPPSHRFKQ